MAHRSATQQRGVANKLQQLCKAVEWQRCGTLVTALQRWSVAALWNPFSSIVFLGGWVDGWGSWDLLSLSPLWCGYGDPFVCDFLPLSPCGMGVGVLLWVGGWVGVLGLPLPFPPVVWDFLPLSPLWCGDSFF